jgi:hypothetical protein
MVMSRIERRQADGKTFRVWLVRIAPHQRLMNGVRSGHGYLAAALLSAIEQAEQGWHRS